MSYEDTNYAERRVKSHPLGYTGNRSLGNQERKVNIRSTCLIEALIYVTLAVESVLNYFS